MIFIYLVYFIVGAFFDPIIFIVQNLRQLENAGSNFMMYLNFYVISRFVCDNIDLFFYALFLYYFSRNGTRSMSQSDSENSSTEKFFKNYNPTMTMHTTLQDDLVAADNS